MFDTNNIDDIQMVIDDLVQRVVANNISNACQSSGGKGDVDGPVPEPPLRRKRLQAKLRTEQVFETRRDGDKLKETLDDIAECRLNDQKILQSRGIDIQLTSYPDHLNPFSNDDDDDAENKEEETPVVRGDGSKSASYPEGLNPFSENKDAETKDNYDHQSAEKKRQSSSIKSYDESLNPFGPPARPPPPVFSKAYKSRKAAPVRPSTPPSQNVFTCTTVPCKESFVQRFRRLFTNKKDSINPKITDLQMKTKWICLKPQRGLSEGVLTLKKGDTVVQTGMSLQELDQGYGYIKKGIFKMKKVWGFFPLTELKIKDDK